MRAFRESLLYWDEIFFNNIFQMGHRRLLGKLIPVISRSGDGYLYPMAALFFWLVNRRLGAMLFCSALVAFAIELPVYKLVKHTVRRYRPCDALCSIERRISAMDRFSFPSGHTAAAFLMATVVSNFFPLVGPFFFAWATAVGFARIYLGVHYPTDVLAGIFLGIGSAATGISIFQ